MSYTNLQEKGARKSTVQKNSQVRLFACGKRGAYDGKISCAKLFSRRKRKGEIVRGAKGKKEIVRKFRLAHETQNFCGEVKVWWYISVCRMYRRLKCMCFFIQ